GPPAARDRTGQAQTRAGPFPLTARTRRRPPRPRARRPSCKACASGPTCAGRISRLSWHRLSILLDLLVFSSQALLAHVWWRIREDSFIPSMYGFLVNL